MKPRYQFIRKKAHKKTFRDYFDAFWGFKKNNNPEDWRTAPRVLPADVLVELLSEDMRVLYSLWSKSNDGQWFFEWATNPHFQKKCPETSFTMKARNMLNSALANKPIILEGQCYSLDDMMVLSIFRTALEQNLMNEEERDKLVIMAASQNKWKLVKLIECYENAKAAQNRFFGLTQEKYEEIERSVNGLTLSQRSKRLYELVHLDEEEKIEAGRFPKHIKQNCEAPENLATIEILLKQGAERKRSISDASRKGHWKIVEIFSTFQTNPYDFFDYSRALLHAVADRRARLAKTLSRAGAMNRYIGPQGCVLVTSLKQCDLPLFEFLLKKYYLNASQSTYREIQYALSRPREIYNGIPPNINIYINENIHFIAVIAKHVPMRNDDLCWYGQSLLNAAWRGDKKLVDHFIAAGAERSPSIDKNWALHSAATNDQIEMFNYLWKEKQYDPLVKNRVGKTAIDIIFDRCQALQKEIKETSLETDKQPQIDKLTKWQNIYCQLEGQLEEQLMRELRECQNRSWFYSKHRRRTASLSTAIKNKGIDLLEEEDVKGNDETCPLAPNDANNNSSGILKLLNIAQTPIDNAQQNNDTAPNMPHFARSLTNKTVNDPYCFIVKDYYKYYAFLRAIQNDGPGFNSSSTSHFLTHKR